MLGVALGLFAAQLLVLVAAWQLAGKIDALLVEVRARTATENSLRETIDSLTTSVDALGKMRDELKREADVRRQQDSLASAAIGGWKSV